MHDDMSGASSRAWATHRGPHPCAVRLWPGPWPCTGAAVGRYHTIACSSLPATASASARQSNGGRFVILVSSHPSRTRPANVTYNVVLRAYCSLHAPRERVRATTHRPERAEAWAGWPCGSPAHMWWILDAGHTMTPPSVSPPSTETSADLH